MTYSRHLLVTVLTFHQRKEGGGGCHCGWGVLGSPHSAHIADVYEKAQRFRPGMLHMTETAPTKNGDWRWFCRCDEGYGGFERQEHARVAGDGHLAVVFAAAS